MDVIVPTNQDSSQTTMETPSFDMHRFSIETECETISHNIRTERERTLSISFPQDPTSEQLNQQYERVPDPSEQLFQNISAPGIADILGGEVGQHRFYYSSRKETELNAELIRAKAKIRQLEHRIDTLFHENERLKNDLELLQQSVVSEDYTGTNHPNKRYWSAAEHRRFLEALRLFGPDNKKAISAYVGTRTVTQIRTHMQKYKMRMNKDPDYSQRIDNDQPQNTNTLSIQEGEKESVAQTTEIQGGQISFQNSTHSTQLPSLQIQPADFVERKEVNGVVPLGKQMEEESEVNNNNYMYNPFR